MKKILLIVLVMGIMITSVSAHDQSNNIISVESTDGRLVFFCLFGDVADTSRVINIMDQVASENDNLDIEYINWTSYEMLWGTVNDIHNKNFDTLVNAVVSNDSGYMYGIIDAYNSDTNMYFPDNALTIIYIYPLERYKYFESVLDKLTEGLYIDEYDFEVF